LSVNAHDILASLFPGRAVRTHTLVSLTAALGLTAGLVAVPSAQVRLADDTDRAAFRAWFVLLAEAQFERPAAEVTDCAALVRYAMREALRAHTPEWVRTVGLPFAPQFPEVRSAPRGTSDGLPLFQVGPPHAPRYAEFADARTIVSRNTISLGRDAGRARPGDLLYFRQPGQRQPDHLMVVVGQSAFETEGTDWVVYHTGPTETDRGEIRKVRLATLRLHPSPRWRPVLENPSFVGLFRLAALVNS
jgi:uncharacterized protein YfaT (DUF1175 family)